MDEEKARALKDLLQYVQEKVAPQDCTEMQLLLLQKQATDIITSKHKHLLSKSQ